MAEEHQLKSNSREEKDKEKEKNVKDRWKQMLFTEIMNKVKNEKLPPHALRRQHDGWLRILCTLD